MISRAVPEIKKLETYLLRFFFSTIKQMNFKFYLLDRIY